MAERPSYLPPFSYPQIKVFETKLFDQSFENKSELGHLDFNNLEFDSKAGERCDLVQGRECLDWRVAAT